MAISYWLFPIGYSPIGDMQVATHETVVRELWPEPPFRSIAGSEAPCSRHGSGRDRRYHAAHYHLDAAGDGDMRMGLFENVAAWRVKQAETTRHIAAPLSHRLPERVGWPAARVELSAPCGPGMSCDGVCAPRALAALPLRVGTPD